MNNAVKSKNMNEDATVKELFLKLQFDTYLMVTLKISFKKHSMQGVPWLSNKL